MKHSLSFSKGRITTLLMIGGAFLIATIISVFVIQASFDRNKKIAEQELDTAIEEFRFLFEEHTSIAISTLRATSGLFAASDQVTRTEFYTFAKETTFFTDYPEFQTLGYAPLVTESNKSAFLDSVIHDTSFNGVGYPEYKIFPEGDRPEYVPIQYIYPESEVDFLLGLDSFGDPIRYENYTRARDTGDVSASTIVALGEGGRGVILALPIYDTPDIPDNVADRRVHFLGAISTVVDVDKFFSHLLNNSQVQRFNIKAEIVGRGNEPISINNGVPHLNFFTKQYGIISKETVVTLTPTTTYTLRFEAPAANFLTFQELYEPVLYALVFLSAALFMTVIIFASQRAKDLNEVRERYQFLATLSHQLRTPITRIKWMMEEHEVSSTNNEFPTVVQRMSSIVERMISYLEINQKNPLEDAKQIGVETLYKKIIASLPKELVADRIERTGSKRVSRSVYASETFLVPAIAYIVENALTYSPEDKKISVEIIDHTNTIVIRVTDHGYGIPEKEQKQMFKEFFRATNASLGKNFGSGVSLSLAKQIIERHGGGITFTSKKDAGSTFEITLPVLKKM